MVDDTHIPDTIPNAESPAPEDANPTASSTAETEAGARPGPGEDPAAPPEAQDNPRPRGVQKRIDDLVREREGWKREAAHWREQALGKRSGPNADPNTAAKAPTDAPSAPVHQDGFGSPKPAIDDFATYDAFQEALTDWKLEEREWRREQAARLETTAREAQERRKAMAERQERARERYPDFDQVIASSPAPATPAMVEAIMDSEHSADLSYHLALHPGEAARIAALPPLRQIREIGRLEARLAESSAPAEPRQRKVTDAPPPITPVGKAATADKDPERLTTAEWMRWRETQLREQSKRR